MAVGRNRVHKHYQLDGTKIKRAQKLFQAKSETEAIETALDRAIEEFEKDQAALAATERFLRSGVEIKDVYGKLSN